jgi:hypothetical protein
MTSNSSTLNNVIASGKKKNIFMPLFKKIPFDCIIVDKNDIILNNNQ